jgi:hypothetical protein
MSSLSPLAVVLYAPLLLSLAADLTAPLAAVVPSHPLFSGSGSSYWLPNMDCETGLEFGTGKKVW